MNLVTEFWHADSKGQKHPDRLRGKRFLHLKTSHLYRVVGVKFNASTDQWALEYERDDPDAQCNFPFTRDMAEFLDGRFLEVK